MDGVSRPKCDVIVHEEDLDSILIIEQHRENAIPYLYTSIVVSVHLYVHWLPHAGPHNGASMHSVPFAGPPRIKGPPAGPPVSSGCWMLLVFLHFVSVAAAHKLRAAG